MPDLALVALLRLNKDAWSKLPVEVRLARLRGLPRSPEPPAGNPHRMPPEDKALQARLHVAEWIVGAACDHMKSATVPEREAFEHSLRSMDDSATSERYRWMGYTALFHAGEAHLEQEARKRLTGYLHDERAGLLLSLFLMVIVARGEETLLMEVNALLEAIPEGDEEGLSAIIFALARLVLHAPPESRSTAGRVLKRLAKHQDFRQDEALTTLITSLGLDDPSDEESAS